MDRTAGPIAPQLRKIKSLGNNPLAREGRVAMHDQAKNLLTIGVAALRLLGPHPTDHHRVHHLQMRWISVQGKMHHLVVERSVGRDAHVVLHVSRPGDVFRIGRVAEKFRDNGAERLVEEIGEHVQPATMRHADDNFFQPKLAAALEDLFKRRDHRFTTIQAKPLGADVFRCQKLLETLSGGQTLQNGFLTHGGKIGLVLNLFDTALDPDFLSRVLHMHVFDADATTIGLLDSGNDLAKRGDLEPEHIVDEDRPVPIIRPKSIMAWIQFQMRFRGGKLKRIEIGFEMTAYAISANQHDGP